MFETFQDLHLWKFQFQIIFFRGFLVYKLYKSDLQVMHFILNHPRFMKSAGIVGFLVMTYLERSISSIFFLLLVVSLVCKLYKSDLYIKTQFGDA